MARSMQKKCHMMACSIFMPCCLHEVSCKVDTEEAQHAAMVRQHTEELLNLPAENVALMEMEEGHVPQVEMVPDLSKHYSEATMLSELQEHSETGTRQAHVSLCIISACDSEEECRRRTSNCLHNMAATYSDLVKYFDMGNALEQIPKTLWLECPDQVPLLEHDIEMENHIFG